MKKQLIVVSLFCAGLTFLLANKNKMDDLSTNMAVTEQIEQQEEIGKLPIMDIEEFDIATKRKKTIDLVERAGEFLQKNPTDKAFHVFSQTKDFVNGELYIFVFDYTGTALAHGRQSSLVWKNLMNFRDQFGTFIVQEMLKKVKAGGGWITYQWLGATKISFVKSVTKGGKSYIIGAGYYPHSKEDAVVNLVKGAVSVFNQVKKEGRPVSEAFSTFSYPLGRFILGDLYIYALAFDGTIMSQGERPGLIGTNSINYKDKAGTFVNKTIIEKLQQTNEGVWVQYVSKGAQKKAYAQKVEDEKGNKYFIACGFYPDADRTQVVELVREGYTHMKRHGKSVVQDEFSDKANNDFRYGDLYLFVYNMEGKCVAHGGNTAFVGKNRWNVQDQDGRYYIQAYIQKAKKDGSGWVDAKLKNSFQTAYVEKIELGLKEYVIGCGVYPISKKETMVLLTKSAASYLQVNKREVAFGQFISSSEFIRGDLDVYVFDDNGICYAYGKDPDVVWRNMFDAKDDEGRPWVKMIINQAKRGAAFAQYKLNNATKVAYLEPVNKDGKNYIVGVDYYL